MCTLTVHNKGVDERKRNAERENEMTSKDARETLAEMAQSTNEKAAVKAQAATMNLEELEAQADVVSEELDRTPRMSPRWHELSAEGKRLEDLIFAITG